MSAVAAHRGPSDAAHCQSFSYAARSEGALFIAAHRAQRHTHSATGGFPALTPGCARASMSNDAHYEFWCVAGLCDA